MSASQEDIVSRMSDILNPVKENEVDDVAAQEGTPAETETDAEINEEAETNEEAEVLEESSEEGMSEEISDDDDLPIVSNFTDFAEHLGLTPEELFKTPVAVDLDGERREVTVEDLKTNFVANERLEKRAAEIAKMREEAQTITQQASEQSQQKILESVAILESVEKRLMDDVNAVDWNTLRQEDPSEWAARKQELMDRQQQVAADKQRVAQAYQQHMGQQQAAFQEQSKEHLARERQKLLDALPSWNNEATMKSEIAEMREYLSKAGFAPEEIDNLSDHRHVLLIRKAGVLDKMNKDVNVTKKRLVKIGSKVARPGSAATKTKTSRSEAEKIRGRLKKTGSVDDFAAYLSANNRNR
tara:strand:+ start:8380 stop:9450 length:1071 start_codon:yes stop_codon:yes gene_type:complete